MSDVPTRSVPLDRVTRRILLAAVVLSACIGLVVGGAAAWVVYQRLGAAGQSSVTIAPQPGRSGDTAGVGAIAQSVAPSVVKIVVKPVDPGELGSAADSFRVGFVASPSGLIVTSAHAVQGATRLRVAFADGHTADATLAGSDVGRGLAVLRVGDLRQVPALGFSDQAPRSGDPVVAVGSPPLAATSTIAGTVSSTAGSLDTVAAGPGSSQLVSDTTSVDAPADPRDDGAPLVDGRGRAVGVVVAVPSSVSPTLVALSGAAARDLVARLDRTGSTLRPSFGVTAQLLDPSTAASVELPAGAWIRSVAASGPGAAAGLQVGDVVTQVDGTQVDASHPLDPVSLNFDPLQQVTLTVVRAGQTLTIRLVVGEA